MYLTFVLTIAAISTNSLETVIVTCPESVIASSSVIVPAIENER